MRTLRLTQSIVRSNRYRVEAALEADGSARQTAIAEFDFHVTPQDREDLRWYLEDYLQNVADPAPKIAARIEGRIADMGTSLFKALFHSDDDTRDLWATVRDHLNSTRVEIITGVREATALPWELIRDPKTDTPLAMRASAFVRAAHQAAQRPYLPRSDIGPVRILLVICRPGGSNDVPFRSVASRLIKGLSESAREAFQLDVLRPPTFEQMSKVLRAKKKAGIPYHVVHFDGHGTYEEVSQPGGLATLKGTISSLVLSAGRAGAHGYLLFENPAVAENLQLVDGLKLGKLLAETEVPVLVLNACRSAHAEAPPVPAEVPEKTDSYSATTANAPDVHTQVRAFGSLAQEIVDAGVAGVVAMRYNVYVVTAAYFVADLYALLGTGLALGEAVTLGRKQLEAQPLREIAYQPRPLQDWMVPIVYEAAPVTLFPKPAQKPELKITVSADATAPSSGQIAHQLEKRPDTDFFGRDETLLGLDRAFDTQAIVLLHAYAGSGKTSTAAEFARWYHLTGGIRGPVLFTSFEQHKPLVHVLNETIGTVFARALEKSGVNWLTLTNEQRLDVALKVMAQIPVLWIWDNVEPVAGFPDGTPSAWSDAEQKELVDFLRAGMQTRAKFLLASRRDEKKWLDNLPARIQVPPMPMQERVQLARALAKKHGRHLADVEDWIPLLRFTEGNPLTITVVVGEALRDGLKTKAQIENFIGLLRAGEKAFEDEATEGRDKSLGASLSYGFEHAFSDADHMRLALLHLFQGFVNVRCLEYMGNPRTDWCLQEISGTTTDTWLLLLERASQLGLLTSHGDGFFTIHPAIPWFLKHLFDDKYANSRLNAVRAFVDSISQLANLYANRYADGDFSVIEELSAQEANLLYVRQLARSNSWWDELALTMVGLRYLYSHKSRNIEWERLTEELVPDLVDPETNGPLPGREHLWSTFTDSRVRLALEARRLEEAENLQRTVLDWDRKMAATALSSNVNPLSDSDRKSIEHLAVSQELLGNILRERSKVECIMAYEEAIKLFGLIGEQHAEGSATFALAQAYCQMPGTKDFDKAEHFYRRTAELWKDARGRAACLGNLGVVAYLRYYEAIAAKRPKEEASYYLTAAAEFTQQALILTPLDAFGDLGGVNMSLGNIYYEIADFALAVESYRQALMYFEKANLLGEAAKVRVNIARALLKNAQLSDARDYAIAALRNYESYGERARTEIEDVRELISEIDRRS